MNRILTMLAGGACAGALAGLAVPAHAAPEITLTRFECGTPQAPIAVNQRFSDSSFTAAISSSMATNICYGTPATP